MMSPNPACLLFFGILIQYGLSCRVTLLAFSELSANLNFVKRVTCLHCETTVPLENNAGVRIKLLSNILDYKSVRYNK